MHRTQIAQFGQRAAKCRLGTLGSGREQGGNARTRGLYVGGRRIETRGKRCVHTLQRALARLVVVGEHRCFGLRHIERGQFPRDPRVGKAARRTVVVADSNDAAERGAGTLPEARLSGFFGRRVIALQRQARDLGAEVGKRGEIGGAGRRRDSRQGLALGRHVLANGGKRTVVHRRQRLVGKLIGSECATGVVEQGKALLAHPQQRFGFVEQHRVVAGQAALRQIRHGILEVARALGHAEHFLAHRAIHGVGIAEAAPQVRVLVAHAIDGGLQRVHLAAQAIGRTEVLAHVPDGPAGVPSRTQGGQRQQDGDRQGATVASRRASRRRALRVGWRGRGGRGRRRRSGIGRWGLGRHERHANRPYANAWRISVASWSTRGKRERGSRPQQVRREGRCRHRHTPKPRLDGDVAQTLAADHRHGLNELAPGRSDQARRRCSSASALEISTADRRPSLSSGSMWRRSIRGATR